MTLISRFFQKKRLRLHYLLVILRSKVCIVILLSRSNMSSNGTVQEEPSPQNETPASKRRRIAFSCLDCRRRKLKCDRLFPSCTRCQKGGHPETCSYDTEAVESALTQSSGERNQTRDFSIANGYGVPRTVPRLPSVARSFAADEGPERFPKAYPEDTTARLYAQEERIRQLEHRIVGLERATHGARSPALTQAELKAPSDSRAAVDKETMIFRGKNFKTQFYGASHHTSYLSHVWTTNSYFTFLRLASLCLADCSSFPSYASS